MIANTFPGWQHSRWILITAFLLVMTSRAQGPQPRGEGDEWLKWGNNTRKIYVRAYAQGLEVGFLRGCDQAVGGAKPRPRAAVALENLDECASHVPSDRDAMKMVSAVTTFYTKYPDQRSLDISDILLGLYAGSSLNQIHEDFAGGRP